MAFQQWPGGQEEGRGYTQSKTCGDRGKNHGKDLSVGVSPEAPSESKEKNASYQHVFQQKTRSIIFMKLTPDAMLFMIPVKA